MRKSVLTTFVLAASMIAAGVIGGSAQSSVMGSRIFDWNSLTAQTTKVGSVRKVVRAPTATLDELEIHITSLDSGQAAHSPHQHAEEELLIVKGGTVEVLVNGETRRVGPGSVVFQASNQMHAIRNVGPGQATYHVIRWKSPSPSRSTKPVE